MKGLRSYRRVAFPRVRVPTRSPTLPFPSSPSAKGVSEVEGRPFFRSSAASLARFDPAINNRYVRYDIGVNNREKRADRRNLWPTVFATLATSHDLGVSLQKERCERGFIHKYIRRMNMFGIGRGEGEGLLIDDDEKNIYRICYVQKKRRKNAKYHNIRALMRTRNYLSNKWPGRFILL